MTTEELNFLEQSNYIEQEYGHEAFDDAVIAWQFAKEVVDDELRGLSVGAILHIHKLLLENLNPRIAGRLRDCAVWIGGRYCPVELPFALIQKLQNWIDLCYNNEEVSEKEAHVRFEQLHPFEDGNGRVGRILMNMQRLKRKKPILIIHEGAEQMEYYKWFNEEASFSKKSGRKVQYQDKT